MLAGQPGAQRHHLTADDMGGDADGERLGRDTGVEGHAGSCGQARTAQASHEPGDQHEHLPPGDRAPPVLESGQAGSVAEGVDERLRKDFPGLFVHFVSTLGR
ncbi:hypothetical protein GCM10010236_07330 [Streptomyces eurythermus]|nr:hypothetical protein GCM10010236_07330 [Streptomyces eurythermus]